jgi:large subunit ribosomal protein L25
MQKTYTLSVNQRDVTGKKVKSLRKKGIIPANIYGKGLSSISVQVEEAAFLSVYNQAGETGVVYLDLNGTSHPVLIHHVQYHITKRSPFHVDFYQVNLKEKVTTMVPVIIEGEAKAVAEKLGILLQTLNQVEVEALPTDLPDQITVDVSHLAAVDDSVRVSDLKAPNGVTILTSGDETVAKITELVAPEPEPVTEAPIDAAETGDETSTPDSTEEPKEESKE